MPKKKNWYEMKALAAPGTAEIFIYDEIGYWGITAKDFARDLKSLGDVTAIDLHINSPGGNVFDGTAIYNLLDHHSATITVYIDGLAASMGSVIAMVGDEIHMPGNALMMIHNPWGGAVGESDDLRKMADVLDKIKASLMTTYMKRTGKSEDEVSQLMDDETWLTGAEAVEHGFADVLADEMDLAASANFDFNRLGFNKAPDIGGGSSNEPAPNKPAAVAAQKPNEEIEMTPEEIAAAKAKAKKDALAAEAKRRVDVKGAFKGFEETQAVLMNTCADDMECTVESAQAKLLAALGNQQTPVADGGSVVTSSVDMTVRNKYRSDVVAAIGARAGLVVPDNKVVNPMAGYTLFELARNALQINGISCGGMTKMQIVAKAFTHTSGDFGQLLADVAHKAALMGYDEAEETFDKWTGVGELADFKAMSRVDLGAFPDLVEVPEGGEYKNATFGDRGETVQLATYGRKFSITRQAVINDDIGAFTRIPRKMGMAGKRTIGNLVYAILTSNPKMADGVALFHATHGNLGTGAAISTSSVSAGRTAMRKQKDGEAFLNIAPKYLLCGVENEGLANVVRASEFAVDGDKNQTVPNEVRDTFEVISDPRLSASAWYQAADQNMHDTVEVQYLDGVQSPHIEQQAGWDIDGTEFKVRIDAGVKALDSKGLRKNPGA